MKQKVTIDDLARMTQNQFSATDERLGRLEAGVKSILEILVDVPPKKITEKLTHRVQDLDERVTLLERKVSPTR